MDPSTIALQEVLMEVVCLKLCNAKVKWVKTSTLFTEHKHEIFPTTSDCYYQTMLGRNGLIIIIAIAYKHCFPHSVHNV